MPKGLGGYQPDTKAPSSRRADFDLQRRLAILERAGGGGEPGGSTIITGVGPPTAGTGGVGDYYIDTAADIMYGPKGSDGSWPVAMDPAGSTGTDEVWVGAAEPADPLLELWYDPDAPFTIEGSYTHIQAVAAQTWTIEHPLNFQPNVTVIDSAGNQVEGDVEYLAPTTIRLMFSGAFSGTAYLS